MLAAILTNLPLGGQGPDARYYSLLRRKKLERKRAEFAKSEESRKFELARQAFEVVNRARPEAAAQIVQPFKAQQPESRRFEIDWSQVIASIVSYECLCRLMLEIEDEELIAMLASDEIC